MQYGAVQRFGLLAAAVLLSTLATGGVVEANETIVDPENPAFEDDDREDDGEEDQRQKEAEDQGGETIFDPENPAFEQDPDDESEDDGDDELIIDDPERPALPEEPEPQGEADFRDTEWGLNYELTSLVEPPIGPRGRDVAEFTGGMGMELRHQRSEQTRMVVSGRFRYWSGAGRSFDAWRTHYEPRLHRAYLVHRADRWSLTFGKMRNSWGSTDIIRPGDVIDPVDFRNPTGGRGFGEEMGQLSGTASYSGDDWSIRGVLVPFFRGHQASLFGRDTSVVHERNPIVGEQLPFLLAAEQLLDPSLHQEVQPFLQATEKPLDTPRNISGGLRGTWTVSGTDLGLGLFVGWDRTPDVDLDEDLRELLALMAEDEQIFDDFDFVGFLVRNPEAVDHSLAIGEKVEEGETLFDSRFRRRATLLADFARYVGPIGVRGDVAFSPRQVFFTRDLESVRRPSLFSALGVSYERLLDGVRPLSMTLEGFWLQPFGPDSAPTRLLVPEAQRGDDDSELLLFEGGYYGLAGATNWATGLWDLEVTAGAVGSISPGDIVGQLAVERTWRRGVRTRLGTNLFFGPDPSQQMSPGGLWAHANRVYLSVGGQF